MTKALRNNEGKPQLSELLKFGNALDNLAAVLEQGAKKYAKNNWLLGGKEDQEYLDSAIRHIKAHVGGELYDPETGCLHLALASWNLMAIQTLNYSDKPSLHTEEEEPDGPVFSSGDFVSGETKATGVRVYGRLIVLNGRSGHVDTFIAPITGRSGDPVIKAIRFGTLEKWNSYNADSKRQDS